MPTLSNRRILLRALKGFDADFKAAAREVADQARGRLIRSTTRSSSPKAILTRSAGDDQADSKIDLRVLPSIQRDVGRMVEGLFVGADGRSSYAADGVTPMAQFPLLLNKWVVWATVQIAVQHRDYMQKRLPDELVQWLSFGGKRVSEQADRLLSPLAFTEFEPTWTWQDARGYTLSDRIWNVSIETRRRIDALLSEGIRTGRSALSIANELEQFLMPGRAALRTTRPYGQDASVFALRLARSEISLAAARVSIASARMNPFVEAMIWNLSESHPKPDVCDSLASGSPYPLTGSVPLPVSDSHPQCLCYMTYEVRPESEVVAELREAMESGEVPYVTPIDMRSFLEQLLGPILVGLALRELLIER